VRAWRAVWSAWSRRIDRDSQRPVPGVTTFLPKFNRVETLDSATVHGRVPVDPRSDRVFSFEQETVEGNI
jgi:hypothetical protein